MSKVFNIGGIPCIVEYHKDYNETFFHPAQGEKWGKGVLDYLGNIAKENGKNVSGGHDYYMAIQGNVFVA